MSFTSDVVIGLEIHVELNTKTKLFCSCSSSGSEEPNTRTCEICLGMPGAKPKLNKKAVEYAAKLAIALNSKLSKQVLFSRKSYFYPDLAKNFQITQYEMPIGEGGYLEVDDKKIHLKRLHLEEDPAALVHPGGIGNSSYVLVDYNRSGNPLCEIVTEPQMTTPADVRDFMKTLITTLLYLKVFNPKKNTIKADANVSIKESGYVRAEIKNITGFKDIERALSYEIERQRQEVSENKKLVQETRAFDSEKGTTFLLRAKETEEDYGYIFEPDIVPVELTKDWKDKLKSEIPELPTEKAKRYVSEYKLSAEDAKVITSEYQLAEIFEKAIKKVSSDISAKWTRRELVRVMNFNKIELTDMDMNHDEFIHLLSMLENKKITEKVAQKVLEKLAVEDIKVSEYIKEHGLAGVSDTTHIEKFCSEAILENPKAAEDFRSGKEAALNFLFGSVMRKAGGKADPAEVKEILKIQLSD
jgi:aspartyl-tRNA(Asn)/glutamyl-tRNA(Gln) amidotransferase subunit B